MWIYKKTINPEHTTYYIKMVKKKELFVIIDG